MATNMPSLPMRGGGGADPATSMQDMVGGPPSGQQENQQAPNPEQEMQQVMARVRDAHGIIEALSRQFPDGAKGARKAKEGLIEMMNAIVSSQRTPEPEAPRGPA